MLLIILLGLIAKLASVCDGCEVGKSEVNNFDWKRVGIVVLTGLMKPAAFKTAACFYTSFVVPITNSQYYILELVCSSN